VTASGNVWQWWGSRLIAAAARLSVA